MKKDLHLNLKKKWFDMILSGEKTEEYREIKPSIISLLFNWRAIGNTREYLEATIKADHDSVECWCALKDIGNIVFSNGYAKDRRQMTVKLEYIEVKKGKQEWGAVKDEFYFVLTLDKVISPNWQ
jgi:hypothetical protein